MASFRGRGRNRRVQEQDPSLHGETDAFRRSGRRRSYRDTVMVTTLAPCWYCSGLVRQLGIPKVVVGESVNFSGGIDWLRQMRRRGRGSGLEAMHRASGRLHRRASRTLARGHRPALRRAGACRRLTTWADGPQAQFAQGGSGSASGSDPNWGHVSEGNALLQLAQSPSPLTIGITLRFATCTTGSGRADDS